MAETEPIRRVVIVSSAEIAARGEILFPGATTVFANGELPIDPAAFNDAVVADTDRQRIEQFCAAFVAVQCPKVREWQCDLSEFTTRQQVLDAAAGIKTYIPSSAPSAPAPKSPVEPPPTVGPAQGEAEPAQEPPQEPENGPQSDAPPPWHDEVPDEREDAAEALLHSIRMASNVVHLRSIEAGKEWPDPETQFSESSDLPEFDPSWIPPPLRDFVLNVHQMQGCDLGIPAIHALTICAGLITDDIKVSVRKQQEWFESPRLWSCVLGKSGDGKSPAQRAITKEVKVLWSEVAERSKTRMAGYKLDLEVYEAQKRIYVAAKAKGDPSGPVPIAPDRPVDEQIYFDSTTVEAIADVLQDSSRGSMLINDELLGWLMGFNQYRQGNDRQFFLESFDGGRRVFNRVGRRWILDSGLSICGNSQPGAFHRAMSNMSLDSDGLIQRVLIYNSLRDAKDGSEVAADHVAIKRWRRISHGLYHLKTHLEHCYFSASAQEVFRQAEAWIADSRTGSVFPDAMLEHLGKYRGFLARIALTMHCIDCADDEREAVLPEIHQDTVQRAWSLLRDCFFPHAMRFYGEIAGDNTRKKALRQITNFIVCRQDMSLTLRRRDMELQCREAWYPDTSPTLREGIRRELLNELIGMGWIRASVAPDRIGKLPAEFAINPRLDAKFASVREAELPKRRAAAQRLLEQKAAKRERQAGED